MEGRLLRLAGGVAAAAACAGSARSACVIASVLTLLEVATWLTDNGDQAVNDAYGFVSAAPAGPPEEPSGTGRAPEGAAAPQAAAEGAGTLIAAPARRGAHALRDSRRMVVELCADGPSEAELRHCVITSSSAAFSVRPRAAS